MINYMIPGLYENWRVNFLLLHLFQNNREVFYDNVDIHTLFGNFQFCIWEGGRIFHNSSHHASKETILKFRDVLNNKYHIPMRFIFTNPNIQEEHCHDRFCNLILQLCDNGQNEIVVNSPILEQYIKENYTSYKFVSSTTKCIISPTESLQELKKDDYFMVCLDYNLNHNTTFLNTIKETGIQDKVELLVNAICSPGCPFRKEHYKLNGQHFLSYGKKYKMEGCTITSQASNPDCEAYKNNLQYEDIVNYNKLYGIENFKIEGRSFDPITHVGIIVPYLIKPKYQFYIMNYLLQGYSNVDLTNINNLERYFKLK